MAVLADAVETRELAPTEPGVRQIDPAPGLVRASIGMFFVGHASLIFEVAIGRVYAVALPYHYTFLVLALALAGFAAGAIADRIAIKRGIRVPPAVWAAFGGFSIVAALLIAVAGLANVGVGIVALTALPPFFAQGGFVARVLATHPEQAPIVYGADLVGAASGALLATGLLNLVGGPVTVLVSSGLAGVGSAASVTLPSRVSVRVASFAILVPASLLILSSSGVWSPVIPVGGHHEKDLRWVLSDPRHNAEIVDTRWSAFGRTDLVSYGDSSGQMGLFVDGAAGTEMFSKEVGLKSLALQLSSRVESIPYHFLDHTQKDNSLIIGAGGGKDVIIHLLSGIEHVTAVEVNPEVVGFVRDYADYNGDIYGTDPVIDVVVEEGRHYLQRTHKAYDVISMAMPITKGGRTYRGYALTEAYLFTKESVQSYVDRLTPEGTLIVVGHGHWESLKLTILMLAALEDRGISASEAMARIYVLNGGNRSVFVYQNRPIQPDQSEQLHKVLHARRLDPETSFVPGILAESDDVGNHGTNVCPIINRTYLDLSEGSPNYRDVIVASQVDLSVPTDDRPFFYDVERGAPHELIALLFAGLAAVVLIYKVGPRGTRWQERRPIAVFVALGIGFILTQIAMLQELSLHVGAQAWSTSLLLFSMLMGGGLSSFVAQRVPESFGARVAGLSCALSAVVVFVGAYAPVSEGGYASGLPSDLFSVVFLVPFGFVLGIPFPLLIRAAGRVSGSLIPWALGINGAAAVLGAGIGTIVALDYGYDALLLAAAASYAVASALIPSSFLEASYVPHA